METQKIEITQINFWLGSELNAFLNLQQVLLKLDNSNTHRDLGDPTWAQIHISSATFSDMFFIKASNSDWKASHFLGVSL